MLVKAQKEQKDGWEKKTKIKMPPLPKKKKKN